MRICRFVCRGRTQRSRGEHLIIRRGEGSDYDTGPDVSRYPSPPVSPEQPHAWAMASGASGVLSDALWGAKTNWPPAVTPGGTHFIGIYE